MCGTIWCAKTWWKLSFVKIKVEMLLHRVGKLCGWCDVGGGSWGVGVLDCPKTWSRGRRAILGDSISVGSSMG
jgi:hypothetical protein